MAESNATESLLAVIIGIPLIAFVDQLQDLVFGGYRKLKKYMFESFSDTDVYRNAESGIVAVLQRNGFTFISDVPVRCGDLSGYLPGGIYRYDRDAKKASSIFRGFVGIKISEHRGKLICSPRTAQSLNELLRICL